MSWPGSTPTASATAAQKPSTCSSRRPAALPTASEPSSTTGSESCSPPPDNGPTADHPPTLKSEEPHSSWVSRCRASAPSLPSRREPSRASRSRASGVGEDADDVGAAFQLLVDPLERDGRLFTSSAPQTHLGAW